MIIILRLYYLQACRPFWCIVGKSCLINQTIRRNQLLELEIPMHCKLWSLQKQTGWTVSYSILIMLHFTPILSVSITIPCLTKRSGTFSGNWSMVFVKLICKKKQVDKLVEFTEFVECKMSNWIQGIAWYLTFASVSYQVLSNKNQENYSIPCNLLWTVCLIVGSTLTFGSFAKYSANLITSERASVTWNKLETFLTNNTITRL